MPASFWLGFALGAPLFGTLGFFIGRLMKINVAITEANKAATAAAIDSALKSDELRDELKEEIKETPAMTPEQLADALNNDFDKLPIAPSDLPKPVRNDE